MSGETGSLQRAHALSAEGSLLLHNPLPTPSSLTSARDLYRQASDLFSAALSTSTSSDEATLRTLQLLVTQHRKLVKDIERRISSVTPLLVLRRSATVSAPSGPPVSTQGIPLSPAKRPTEPAGLAAAVRQVSPFAVTAGTATHPGPGIYGSRGPTPFALRPPTASTSVATPGHEALSPLYSSSSSSEPDPAESYITFGLGLDPARNGRELDPFSRFWGMLEECLDEVSRPLVFASAPLGPRRAGVEGRSTRHAVEEIGKSERKGKGRSRTDGAGIERAASPSDSWNMIPSDTTHPAKSSNRKSRKGSSSSIKTPEELVLENESLRLSLDALAVHAQQLDMDNKELRAKSMKREKVLRSVARGVRKEAEKARLDTSMLRSQVLLSQSQMISQASVPVNMLADSSSASRVIRPSPIDRGGRGSGGSAGEAYPHKSEAHALRKKVREMEEEIKGLKVENEKQNEHIQKYKDRFDKIKANAWAKRDARTEEGRVVP